MATAKDSGGTAGDEPGGGPARALRVVLIGAVAEASAIRASLGREGAAGSVAIIADAGRMTPPVLKMAAAADAVVVVSPQGAGFPEETRRECLLAWSVGARPVLAVESGGPRDVGEVRATGEAFSSWAHKLGHPKPAWFELGQGARGLAGKLAAIGASGHPASLRLWVDGVAPDGSGGTILTGTPISGDCVAGSTIVVLPQCETAVVLDVASEQAKRPGETVRLRLSLDRPLGIAAGALLVSREHRPEIADQVAAHVVWAGETPLLPGRSYTLRLGPQRVGVQVGVLKHKLNPADLDPIAARLLGQGETGLANLSFAAPIVFESYDNGPALSRFSLHDPVTDAPVGYGRIAFALRRATNIHWQALSVDKVARAAIKGQRPCCLWLTGLSGSGKSTVASLLERRLNADGRHTYTLDGDNVRHGLNRDLGFTDADRVENIRRVAEVARLFVDAGLITIVSFISPFRAERRMARDLLPAGEFFEIFVDTPIEICEQRDAKGLYRKARSGLLKNFTGIDSPYEPPERPDIHLKGGESLPEAHVETIYLELQRRGMV